MSRSRNSRKGSKPQHARRERKCYDCNNYGCPWCTTLLRDKRTSDAARIESKALRVSLADTARAT